MDRKKHRKQSGSLEKSGRKYKKAKSSVCGSESGSIAGEKQSEKTKDFREEFDDPLNEDDDERVGKGKLVDSSAKRNEQSNRKYRAFIRYIK